MTHNLYQTTTTTAVNESDVLFLNWNTGDKWIRLDPRLQFEDLLLDGQSWIDEAIEWSLQIWENHKSRGHSTLLLESETYFLHFVSSVWVASDVIATNLGTFGLSHPPFIPYHMSPSQMPNSQRRWRAFGDNLMTYLCILSQCDHLSQLLKVCRALIGSNSEVLQSAQKNFKVKLIVLALKAEEKIIELEKAFVQSFSFLWKENDGVWWKK